MAKDEIKASKAKTKGEDRFTEALMPENDGDAAKYSLIFMVLFGFLSLWFSTIEVIVDEIAFDEEGAEELTAVMELKDEKKEEKKEKKKKNPKKRKKTGGGGKQRGKGRPDAPQSRGVLKLLATKTSKSGFSAYSLMNDKKFAKDLDKVLSQVGGLKKTGRSELTGRKGSATAGFNSGYAEGGSGGIGDMLGGLLGGGSGSLGTGAKGSLRPPRAKDIDMGAGGGTRSKASIMKVVRRRSPGLRHVYTKYLKASPGFAGKVTLTFTISPSGSINKISVSSSTTGNSKFDNDIKRKVKGWKFEVIKSGNTTVTIPFTFSE
jgi:TonB family protein